MNRPRAIFFGTPDFAVPSLEALTELADVALVVTQPDRPAGRGMHVEPTPVKRFALARSIPVEQPTKIRTPEFAGRLRELAADVALVTAYGRILPPAVLEAARLGCANVHASLLPRWRGAAPIQWAVASGDRETGVCLMQMDEGMDTGPLLACARTDIGLDETAGALSARLARLGAELVRREFPRFLAGELGGQCQSEVGVTHAPLLTKDHGRVNWHRPAGVIDAQIRAMTPWPGAFSHMSGVRVKILRAHVVDGSPTVPGTICTAHGKRLEVACGESALSIDELQIEGKKRLRAAEFLAGGQWREGDRFDPGEGGGAW